ncbi:hypothetical protein [Agromyces sp. Soil535]|uniref:hypothetical protein n=1 Tax=Agromyces sp. Soil535 TaxID=1736390 RepID=UPI0006F59DB7|nr:hypothetical protein [Agromyces sp. Soil535]KRE22343.1 hypothetical protein ASG80_10420 [Agromyces sp. Soil535]
MDLTQYVNDLRRQLEVAAEAGGDEARQLAERLTAPLDSASRLVLLEALSDAAGEITRELAPGSVELRLRGRDPEFVVTQAAAPAFEEVAVHSVPASPVPPAPIELDEGSTSRTTLRLPDHLKVRVEEAAARDGISVNAWLVRAVGDALEPKGRRAAARDSPTGQHFTGWVR